MSQATQLTQMLAGKTLAKVTEHVRGSEMFLRLAFTDGAYIDFSEGLYRAVAPAPAQPVTVPLHEYSRLMRMESELAEARDLIQVMRTALKLDTPPAPKAT